MSDETKEEPAKKKGKGMMVKLAFALSLVAVGGGAAFGMLQAGIIGGGGHAEADKPDVPELIQKGEDDPYAVAGSEGEGEGTEAISGEGGSKYRTSYFTFSDEFTSNLRGSTGLIQVSIAVSTHYDGRVLMWLKKHELAVRSRVVTILADTPEERILTPDGKEELRGRLADGINQVLTDAEGFGGVDAVHFRSLLVQ